MLKFILTSHEAGYERTLNLIESKQLTVQNGSKIIIPNFEDSKLILSDAF